MAIACLRLVTFLPERPLRSVPCLRSCIARSTFLDAFLLYFFAIAGCSTGGAHEVRCRLSVAVVVLRDRETCGPPEGAARPWHEQRCRRPYRALVALERRSWSLNSRRKRKPKTVVSAALTNKGTVSHGLGMAPES